MLFLTKHYNLIGMHKMLWKNKTNVSEKRLQIKEKIKTNKVYDTQKFPKGIQRLIPELVNMLVYMARGS